MSLEELINLNRRLNAKFFQHIHNRNNLQHYRIINLLLLCTYYEIKQWLQKYKSYNVNTTTYCK